MHSTLNSIGGIQVLFPLFAQLDLPSADPTSTASEADEAEAAKNEVENKDGSTAVVASSTETAVASGSSKDQSLW